MASFKCTTRLESCFPRDAVNIWILRRTIDSFSRPKVIVKGQWIVYFLPTNKVAISDDETLSLLHYAVTMA